MADTPYPRGSEWRKWDLHVHTPLSYLNNQFPRLASSGAPDWERYVAALEALDVAVLGIGDYFSVEGYRYLKGQRDRGRLQNLEAILPNVELRLNTLVPSRHGAQDRRLNLHVIFSDQISPDDIEQHFLAELYFTYEGHPQASDDRRKVKRSEIEGVGQRLIEQHGSFHGRSALEVGAENITVDPAAVSALLVDQKRFAGKYLIVLPADELYSDIDWSGQGHLIRKTLLQMSDLVFSSNAKTRAWCLGHLPYEGGADQFRAEFRTLKGCVHGSDAHDLMRLGRPCAKRGDSSHRCEGTPDTCDLRHCWIKADPTFEGLKQLTNEPADRVFIGDVPPTLERTKRRATRVVTSMEIRRLTSATTTERWFDCEVPLNAELVAVIGNKGSGKSALSDTLGLLGNTPRHGSFSFLNEERFRSPKGNKARQFHARMTWADGTVDTVPSLDANPSADAVEKIKYIPQNYLEEICNEIGSGKGSRFYRELQQVIFSHVDGADRLGFATLDDLLAHHTEETNRAIEQLVQTLRECNEQYVATRRAVSVENRKVIEAQLAEKRREHDAHAQTKPKDVPKPGTEGRPEETRDQTELGRKQAELKDLETEIAALRATDAVAARKRATTDKLLGKIKNLERQIGSLKTEIQADLEELELGAADILTVTVDTGPIVRCAGALDAQRTEIASKLNAEVADSPEQKRRAAVAAIEALQLQLSAPERAYQSYVQALKEWEATEQAIVGNEDLVGSIRYLEKQLAGLAALPKQQESLEEQRGRILLEIYNEKQTLRSFYEKYFGGVQAFLREHPLAASNQLRLTFNVSMTESGFADSFLGMLNRRKSGAFMGEEDGASEMKRLLDGADFSTPEGALQFVRTLFGRMEGTGGRKATIEGQLKQGASLKGLYDYVYSLEYLLPIYNLRWDGKGLEQLSPGERGNLLLIFYLLVDRDDVPLVIDQPEENLDNQTVFRTLVPCIKDAKKRRQIVLVTHNPNLAVVCDAEQVIYSEMRKDGGNEVSYVSGAIEDPGMNRHIVDILEGTRPAFDKRNDKYIPELSRGA